MLVRWNASVDKEEMEEKACSLFVCVSCLDIHHMFVLWSNLFILFLLKRIFFVCAYTVHSAFEKQMRFLSSLSSVNSKRRPHLLFR